MGGSFRVAVDEPPTKRILRAIDVQTGRIAWEIAAGGGRQLVGRHVEHRRRRGVLRRGERRASWPSTPSTAACSWAFQTNQFWKASPMTYVFDEKQYVAVAAGSDIIAFGLPD